MVVSVINLYIGIAAFLFTIMAVIVSESAEARIIFTTLAACAFFLGGFDLLVSAFNLPVIIFYVTAGLSIIGAIVYAGMSATTIVNRCNSDIAAKCGPNVEEHTTVNLHK
jgi:hypothetical protein